MAPTNHRSRPGFDALVEARFHLTVEERTLLQKEGFVVSERLALDTWAWTYHELFKSQMPLYVSVDAIFHAIYAANDKVVALLEREELRPRLSQVLEAMHCGLAAQARNYSPELVRDLDLYLTVARSLLADGPQPALFGSNAEAKRLFQLAREGKGGLVPLEIFGRKRQVDVSQFTPRGHYTEDLAPYFRAAMWLARLELNLVSRSCRSSPPDGRLDPTETPREAMVAMALADLVERTGT